MKRIKRLHIKKLDSLLLCMVLLLLAETGTVVQVKADEPVFYDVSAGDIILSADGDYIITGATETYTIQVAKDVNANVTLDNVSVTTNSIYAAPFTIADNSTGNVSITLAGDNKLTSNVADCAALQKNGSSEDVGTLTIQGDGSLTAVGGQEAAGIGGGGYGESGCNITINSGTVTANGGIWAAGIGGASGGSGSNITISGGTVKAVGGNLGAGIGGGSVGTGSNITISGGTVTAVGGTEAAGIGGGNQASGSNIIISGGIVTAAGETGRDGIDDLSSQVNWKGLVFQNSEGRIYGDSLELTQNLTIQAGSTLTINEGQTLSIASGVKVTVIGTIANAGTIIQHGELEIDGSGSISGNQPQKEAIGISLDKNRMVLLAGDTGVLTATVDPEETFEEVIWNCNDESIVALNADGRSATMTAKKAGETVITATAGAFRASCEIVVNRLSGTAEVSVKDIYYGCTPVVEFQSTNDTNNAVVQYRSLNETDAAYTEEVPKQPGSYRVRVTVPETEKYTEAAATADFKITYLPTPEQPCEISGIRGENGFYISPVTITPAKGYRIAYLADGVYRNTVTFQTSREQAAVYLMNSRGEKTGAVPVEAFRIDTELPVIEAEDESICYGDKVVITVRDDNLSRILVNGKAAEFTGTSAEVSLDGEKGKKGYQITAIDLAGNKSTVNIIVAPVWMESGVVPAGSPVYLMTNQGYTLGNGAWQVEGDATTYTGSQAFYVDSEGEYIFIKQ